MVSIAVCLQALGVIWRVDHGSWSVRQRTVITAACGSTCPWQLTRFNYLWKTQFQCTTMLTAILPFLSGACHLDVWNMCTCQTKNYLISKELMNLIGRAVCISFGESYLVCMWWRNKNNERAHVVSINENLSLKLEAFMFYSFLHDVKIADKGSHKHVSLHNKSAHSSSKCVILNFAFY